MLIIQCTVDIVVEFHPYCGVMNFDVQFYENLATVWVMMNDEIAYFTMR